MTVNNRYLSLHSRLPLWRLSHWRRRMFEAFGSRRFSTTSLGGIGEHLASLFDSPGYFVEAGAVDGVFESNTYELERFHGWKGVLVEPVPELCARIRTTRPRSRAFNCALVSPAYSESRVSIESAHACSRVTATDVVGQHAVRIHVPARTLTGVLEEAGASRVDLLSLDVEGFEIEVLKGLDLTRYRPQYILVECLSPEAQSEMDAFLEGSYRVVQKLTWRDVLYVAE